MKKYKSIILILSIFMLSSCSFVKFVNTEEKTSSFEFISSKEEYIVNLENYSNESLYKETERKTYISYIVEGKSLILESESIDDIKDIYDKYIDLISKLKTIKDYEDEALLNYKESNKNIVSNYLDINLYRIEEKNNINQLISEYNLKIDDAADNNEIDDLVREYKIKTYSFKTDKEYYSLELEKLIDDSKLEIHNYKNESNYRSNEIEVIESIISSFELHVVSCNLKEDVTRLVSSYKEMLDSVKTDKELYEEERVLLVEESYNELLKLVDLNSMTESSEEEYLNYCLDVKNEMLSMKTKELIKSRLALEKQNIYLKAAQLGDKNSLIKYQEIIAEDLYNYLNFDLYREEQQTEIITIINSQGKLIKKQDNFDDTIVCIENCHNMLDAVLTNEEMWEKEDSDFLDSLNLLYGTNVLEKPESLTVASNYSELAKIIDFYAFYQLDGSSFLRDTFRVKCNFEKDKNANYIKNEVYWYCELLNASVGIEFSVDINTDYYVIKLIPYDYASTSTLSVTSSIQKLNWVCDYNSTASDSRGNDFDSFEYLNYSKKVIVWSSQQLWYALENEYEPIPVSGSKAEILLEQAKTILRGIIKNDMTTDEKIYRIFEWISNNIRFDFNAYSYNTSSDMDNYPDENYSRLNSMHLEGGLLDGLCVCAGFAKTYLTLLRIEGIEAIKVISRAHEMSGKNTINSRDYGGGGFGFHEFVYVKIDGKWYYSDAERSCLENDNRIHSYIYLMLSPLSQDYGFGVTVKDLDISTSRYNEIYSNILYNDKNVIQNFDELLEYFSINSLPGDEISIIIESLELSTYLDKVLNYSNLTYSTHSKKENNTNIIELMIIKE